MVEIVKSLPQSTTSSVLRNLVKLSNGGQFHSLTCRVFQYSCQNKCIDQTPKKIISAAGTLSQLCVTGASPELHFTRIRVCIATGLLRVSAFIYEFKEHSSQIGANILLLCAYHNWCCLEATCSTRPSYV